ncbi:flippase [Vibrio aestuarianus]|uniref:Flippase n=1 Tax=Vibrio aestuarianus TaxID=28171 RepID=A0A9X4FB72_9VIBR|nr:flippase [Vibrio aestuarianus]MDE1348416.1 flippase [Vibrio aestuarianus]
MSIKKNTIWNIVGSVLPLLLGALTIPFIITEAGLEVFGILTLVWALIGYFSLFDFGLGRALTQIVAKLNQENKFNEVKDFVNIGIFLIFILGLLGGLLILSLAFPFSEYWLGVRSDLKGDVLISLCIAAVGIPLTTLSSGLKGVLEGYLDFRAVNILRVLLGMGNFGFPALTVYFLGASLPLMVASLVLTRLLVLIPHITLATKKVEIELILPSKNKTVTKELLGFGSWMTLSNIISPLMVTADRFIVSGIVGASLVAYYTVPFEVLIRFLILPGALTAAFFPQVTALLSESKKNAKKFFKKCILIVFVIMFITCVSTALLSPFALEFWIDKDFSDNSWYIASIISIGILFNSIAQIPHATVQAVGNVKATSIVHLFEFVIYLPILIIAVTYFGLIGAAVTWVFRAGLDMLLMFHLVRKVFD